MIMIRLIGLRSPIMILTSIWILILILITIRCKGLTNWLVRKFQFMTKAIGLEEMVESMKEGLDYKRYSVGA